MDDAAEPDVDLLDNDDGDRVHRVLVQELGEEMADAYLRSRRGQEAWYRERRPDEGLRERKKRITRQQISDVATALFVVRGFENVRVADIAAVVGVSEKTVYNYFPTKESMVFDLADEGASKLSEALRNREPGQSPTMAVMAGLQEDLDHFLAATSDGSAFIFTTFGEMIRSHPSLRAAWLELQERFVAVVVEELAISLGVDPRDPEPVIAARAVVGLQEIFFQSLERHIGDGHRGEELRAMVIGDLERATRLLDTGLWSLEWLTAGAKARTSAKSAERAAAQVMAAVQQARAAWQSLKGDPDAFRAEWQAAREASRAERDAARAEWHTRRDALKAEREATRAQWQAKREASRAGRDAWRAAREAGREAERAARQSFAEAGRQEAADARERAGETGGKRPKR